MCIKFKKKFNEKNNCIVLLLYLKSVSKSLTNLDWLIRGKKLIIRSLGLVCLYFTLLHGCEINSLTSDHSRNN